jgi:hypothetical protein
MADDPIIVPGQQPEETWEEFTARVRTAFLRFGLLN